MLDIYSLFYKNHFEDVSEIKNKFDIFFSAYDDCDRTIEIFDGIVATKKIWLIFPHYSDISNDSYNKYDYYFNESYEENVYFENIIDKYSISSDTKICIDITGFIRPHLVYFIVLLYRNGIKNIDFLYTEPNKYENFENTKFTKDTVFEVSEIPGCSSNLSQKNLKEDLLIIASGYDDKLTQKLVQHYERIKNKQYLIGFPSLQLDMYQESILKLNKIIGDNKIYNNIDYSPAMDPFATARKIDKIISEQNPTNIYLCPVSTKPHTLGVILYYLLNYDKQSLSLIFPYSRKYKSKTAIGKKRIWLYRFEL